jgi:small-conductance mechanosensitive channel
MTTTPTFTTTSTAAGEAGPGWRPLLRHYVEMLLAMAGGMLVFGGLRTAAGLTVAFAQDPALSYLLMALDMSAGMAAWMRYRGHRWSRTLEMCAAMFVPLVMMPLVWTDVMDGMTFMIAAHIVMPVAMLVVLLRRRHEYTHC